MVHPCPPASQGRRPALYFVLLSSVLALLGGGTAYGQTGDAAPLSAPPATLSAAVASAPALQAARQRVHAARVRQETAGRVSDASIEGMYSRRQMNGPDMPMWEVTLRQPLPKRGERAADRARAEAVLAMAEAEFTLMAGEMAADVAMALTEAEAALERTRLLEKQRDRTRDALSSVDARLAAGRDRLASRLVLQTRIASLEVMVERERRMHEDALSQARGLLGLPASAALPAYHAPDAADIDADRAPAVLLAHAASSEAAAMAAMARASAHPMTSVGLRFEREETRMGDEDTVGVAFMTDIPWRSRRYARADERAALAEREASALQEQAVRHRIAAALSRVARAERLAEVTLRLTGETRQRLDAEYEAVANASGTGEMSNDSSVLLILETLEKTTETDIQAIDAATAARLARAELWRYAPPTSFQR